MKLEIDQIAQKARGFFGSIGMRLFTISLLTMMLLIPAGLVGALIWERQARRQGAIQEVAGMWGGEQTLSGPILQVPYRRYVKDEKGVTQTVTELATFLPADLEFYGSVSTEVRHRGIYDVVLYKTALKVSGRFVAPHIDEQDVAPADVLWNRAFLIFGITDPRGIEKRVDLHWNGVEAGFQSGLGTSNLVGAGIHIPVSVDPKGGTYRFAFHLAVRGHDALKFLPVGAQTKVDIHSTWPHPSFNGSFVPVEHRETAGGFEARWNVLDINRSFPQSWLGNGTGINGYDFGVNLIQPVDDYQKSDRAHKYAILFITVTFITLFFIEMLKNERVHLLNYILTGLAICLFYTILLSVSEFLGFDRAYGIAAVATTGMITWHIRNILAQRNLCRAVGGTLAIVYGYMYILFQMKDFSLLFGSVGLFILLAITMAASSRITGAAAR